MELIFAHVACCVDGSPAAERAQAEARRLAGPDGRLSLVHVVETPVIHAEAMGVPSYDPGFIFTESRDWLDSRAEEVPGAEAVLLEGHPPTAVCRWAETAKPDLIVAAAHRGLIERLFLGSFANFLAQHSPTNVLLVRPPTQTEEE